MIRLSHKVNKNNRQKYWQLQNRAGYVTAFLTFKYISITERWVDVLLHNKYFKIEDDD